MSKASLLIVDLDGTLVKTDLFIEAIVRALIMSPVTFLNILFVYLKSGKAAAKAAAAEKIPIYPELLPYRTDLIDELLNHKKVPGNQVWLATGSNERNAWAIQDHLGIFDKVLASSAASNFSGKAKARAVISLLEDKTDFEYIGNSFADLPLIKLSNKGVLFTDNALLKRRVAGSGNVEIRPTGKGGVSTWLTQLRVHQIIKNLLIFVPLFTAHLILEARLWPDAIQAFIAFSFASFSIYILNDLVDVWSDRSSTSGKKNRPLASGSLSPLRALIIAFALIFVSISISLWHSFNLMVVVLGYAFLTLIYSLGLKRLVLIDAIALSIMYLLRIVAGSVAINVTVSFWILNFSLFLFFSLALLKRYSEMRFTKGIEIQKNKKIAGRAYRPEDEGVIGNVGVSSGIVACLIFALYVNDAATKALYTEPYVLWLGVSIILFWISWMWFQAHLGQVKEDPVTFAIRDSVSLVSGFTLMTVFVIASII